MRNYVTACILLSCGLESEILNDTQLEKSSKVSEDQTLKMMTTFSALNVA